MSAGRSRRGLRLVGWGRIPLPWTRRRLQEAEDFAQELIAEAIARNGQAEDPREESSDSSRWSPTGDPQRGAGNFAQALNAESAHGASDMREASPVAVAIKTGAAVRVIGTSSYERGTEGVVKTIRQGWSGMEAVVVTRRGLRIREFTVPVTDLSRR